jgi:hypothetical protein
MSRCRFSIVIPTYDRPEQLRECLLAIQRLDFAREAFEIIVVDDGSRVSMKDHHRFSPQLSPWPCGSPVAPSGLILWRTAGSSRSSCVQGGPGWLPDPLPRLASGKREIGIDVLWHPCKIRRIYQLSLLAQELPCSVRKLFPLR